MKVLDFAEANGFLQQQVKKHVEVREKITAVENAMKKLQKLKGVLEGEGAEALKEHYRDKQTPTISKLREFNDHAVVSLEYTRVTMLGLDEETALWRESFMSDEVPSGLNALEDAIEESLSEINSTLSSVSDLVSTDRVHTDELFETASEARTHSQETAEALVEFDDDCIAKLEPSEESLSEWSSVVAKIG
ncbi:T7SS effector LXG polymorphic toxin [Shouchella lonarensis]|uniref:LXG domain of WXG superfamily protein n=1 Tax=Shouchella lonarensis TaxID=1464122 RepID=A0A1G6HZD8_9BACI|nr:T7SS effector LXG polymorphic toxin [Shouchella lonarensis]SDB99560.1 LXG domain of WXG superfamily protein [Shouchella lonarensis]